MHKVDRLLHDNWVRSGIQAVPDDVVIAALDAQSLGELGRWPWSRAQIATLLDKIGNYDVRAVVIDVYFAERGAAAQDDRLVANAIARLPASVLPVLVERGSNGLFIESLPVPAISRVVTSIGHIDLPIDDDGIVRRVFLKSGIKSAHWPALALAALEVLDESPDSLPGKGIQNATPFDEWLTSHEALIPFYGTEGTFTRISAVDIIQETVPSEELTDKIVFVGLTTKGLGDVVPTPFSALNQPMPGVEIHANIFSALRDGLMVERINPYLSILVACLLLPFMILVYSRTSPEWALLNAIAASVVPVIISFFAYHYARVWFAPLSSSLPILISYLLWSRHRLHYINRFLEREHAKSELQNSRRQTNDNDALIGFFESAYRHLPVKAWRFSAGRDIYSGGQALPARRVAGGDDAWALRDNIYARRYPGKQALHIEFSIDEPAKGVEITELIDSLSRVRAREQASPFSDSIERLQTNAQTLSEQLDWLRSVKAFSDSMLAGSPAGFAVWNAAGECVRANDLAYQLVPGYSEYGDLQEFVNCVDQGDDCDKKDARHLQNLLLDREPWQITYRQQEREVIINFRAVGDKLSRRLVCASIVDVSDIRSSERARAELVDYLSHDLRSPLISALYLLEKNDDPRIERNINTSLAMMDNLLHVARADSLSEAQFQPLLLNAILDNTLDQLLPQALGRDINFDIHTDDDLWVNGDAASLERAFTNIVGNAIKYSPDSTTITVRLNRENAEAVLTVDDQGVGIAPEMLKKLFNRFKRDAATAGEFKGIGLGLALVSRVVNLHNGQVAASNITDGTRITLQLPLEEDLAELTA